ncbi:PTS system, beta-glucosides-specific IIC component [Tessaracoccus bendigoensis DSM 12906]|uniref:PTS system, beta-glucosides-specific IIC component n=1 Tax=Tessaracoccus bendigoensis DSM 12906 TaxID=1123357 RepID=A0A1M6F9G9_9ACTN|nr:PTS transporter subunit EIIC [Tessaracoccus bendigoensis]SHI94325.1 PTS system, beta-glucosides-specific IIC component [Tessaracoccus bendigoensis DSM 12906]
MSTAEEIIKSVGGADNVVSLSHCATRLRFQLVDASGIDVEQVESIKGVMGAVPQAGDRFQIIMGGAVQNAYNEINALPEMQGRREPTDAELKAAAKAGGVRGKFAWIDSFFEFLSDSFRPILGALLGASLFITFMSLMSTLGVIGNWADPRTELEPSWQFVNLLWKSVFVFLPLMVAYNASKKLNADPWVGFAIMALVMLPGFTDLGASETAYTATIAGSDVTLIDIFGVPLTIFSYDSQVFPPLLMAGLLGPLYKLLKKLIPDNLQLIFVPFLAMLIMLPLTAFLIGPIGVFIGAWVAGGLGAINAINPLIFAIIIPLAYPFMVPLGLHWPLNAVMLLNIQQLGYDYIQGPMGAWNFACFGATAGVLVLAWRDRDVQMRQTATGALAAGLLGGISEPSLYGIHLRFKKIYPRMLVGCLVGGLTIGIGGALTEQVTTQAFVFTSLLTIPAFNNMPIYGLAVGLAFITSMAMVVVFDYRTPEQKAAAKRRGDADAPPEPETRVIVVGDVETNQAKQWVGALGGEDNIVAVEPIAETRVRVEVKDTSMVDADALRRAGLAGVIEVSPGVWHLVAGLEADKYAEGMRRRLAAATT